MCLPWGQAPVDSSLPKHPHLFLSCCTAIPIPIPVGLRVGGRGGWPSPPASGWGRAAAARVSAGWASPVVGAGSTPAAKAAASDRWRASAAVNWPGSTTFSRTWSSPVIVVQNTSTGKNAFTQLCWVCNTDSSPVSCRLPVSLFHKTATSPV